MSASTIRDVARACGVSTATVSLVLNQAPRARQISAATQAAVRAAARRLRYHPNHFARSLAAGRGRTVGVIVPDITDPYCTQILRGIENTLYRAAHLSLLTDIQNDGPRLQRYTEMLLERRVDGLIMVGNSLLLRADLPRAFAQRRIPLVLVGREPAAGGRAVVVDNVAGARAGLAHLWELGHRRIAFIRGPKGVLDTARRWRGVTLQARALGLRLNPRWITALRPPGSSYEGGFAAAGLLLAAGRRPPWTALMAYDDMTAFGAIRALARAGLRVPEDCSVLGFDDVAAAAFHNPPLSTIHQPLEMLGAMGGELLLEAIAASSDPRRARAETLRLTPDLVARESTAAARRG